MTRIKAKQKNDKKIVLDLETKFDQLSAPKQPSVDTNIYLFDEINEKTSMNLVSDLNDIMDMLDYYEIEDSNIYIHLNTVGGDVSDMFAIVDSITAAKKRGFIIHTIGLGKVMSAGLIVLASGSEGFRSVGKNTRLMFHEVRGDTSGTYDHIKNEYKEIVFAQNEYIKSLTLMTKKDKKFYQDLLLRKNNYYFTAKEAVTWGIADKIL